MNRATARISSLWGHFTMMALFEEDKAYIDAALVEYMSCSLRFAKQHGIEQTFCARVSQCKKRAHRYLGWARGVYCNFCCPLPYGNCVE
jgi:hypothetical protein